MINKQRKIFFIIGSIVLVALIFLTGVYYGFNNRSEIEKITSLSNKESEIENLTDFTPFWKAWNILNEKSIYTKDISDQDRVWSSIAGLASSLNDPYTVFFAPEENKLFNDAIHGSFGGIGAEIGIKDKILTIIAPLKDTPAWKAGIKQGDKILKIDKEETTNMTIDKAISLIRGEKGTVVSLIILREGEKQTREIKITRDTIKMPTIDTKLVKDDIFLISFYSFSENSAEIFYNSLREFSNSGASKLIIDLRGNPGGYLDSSINIASWFLDEGKTIVIEDFGSKKKQETYRSHGPRLFTDQLKLVILVDGGSASASEILAGALQEHKVATLVGETTFGKGSVQELVKLTNDTSLKITIAKWLTPNGLSISEAGLKPDIVVPVTLKDFENDKDPQLEKAIEILQK